MTAQKQDIISLLRREILPLEGLRSPLPGEEMIPGLGFMREAFPNGVFPLGAVHEFICEGPESAAASSGFISGLIGALMKKGSVALWIGSSRTVFPPALKGFGIEPERIIFIDLHKEKDLLWVMEEGLKCNGLAAVVGEMPGLGFTESRRFQLAVEQSRVTGFILRPKPRNPNTNACISRWRINSLPSESYDGLPGLGNPRWNVELLKIRNGKPGIWQMEWSGNQFHPVTKQIPSLVPIPKRKTG